MSLNLIFQSKNRLLTTTQRIITTTTNIQKSRSMTSFSHMSNNDPEVLHKEKEKQKKTGHKEWNEKLASESEAAVKADQDKTPKSVKELQEETKKKLKEE
ncbi:hypothetical protein INT45_003032 [Circinella minor]|uniref:Uncharacterized protein n=1 Tax=Circinella minor TaxID=1195481 RepID=A0A8H7RTZ6_9FUNG|nr:hypothetical protein INT45_003032 [Circinella minor]